MKKYIPASLKLKARVAARFIDYRFIKKYKLASLLSDRGEYKHKICIKQEIKKSHLFENKIHNIGIAAHKIAGLKMAPGEVFSFWETIGKPSPSNGYKKGRNIIDGKMKEGYGGGLCQVSGILYHLALLSNLEVIERHNHSVDLYNEDTRYAPIGTDATVVYGYKDLLIRNNTEAPVRWNLEVHAGLELVAELQSKQTISQQKIQTSIKLEDGLKIVDLTNSKGAMLSTSTYKEK